MSLLLAPYNASMKLGSGFNSYTQQLCIDHAVVKDDTISANILGDPHDNQASNTFEVPQAVSFKPKIINKTSDLTNALNIAGALIVKASSIANATGNGSFVDANEVNTSDLNFLISCKVVNQTIMENHLTKFVPIPNLKAENFNDVFGDCFISGFQIGGEFNALISIKIRDQTQKEEISAKAALLFTTPGFLDKGKTQRPTGGEAADAEIDEKASNKKESTTQAKPPATGGLSIEADATVEKKRNDVLSENEITISVSWTGGGQGLKSKTADWNFETLREAAIKFPDLVAMTPVRTNAILTKYTALRSFNATIAQQPSYVPLSYENAGAYTTILQDAYLDYKNIYKQLQLLTFDVCAGTRTLERTKKALPPPENSPVASRDTITDGSPSAKRATDAAKESAGKDPSSSSNARISGDDAAFTSSAEGVLVPKHPVQATSSTAFSSQSQRRPYIMIDPYEPTVYGVVKAKKDVRIMMGRIADEVDMVAKDPRIAEIETREQPFMSPLLFKQLLPTGVIVSV